MNFASDNTSGVPPQILDALNRANAGSVPSYGADALSHALRDRLRTVFEAPEAEVMLVSTGTAANSIALATICPPWGSVHCHRLAHIACDECGAPEFYTAGAKLALIDGPEGKITPAALAKAVASSGRGVVHSVQPAALSLTNLTECGTCYSVTELAALCDIAHAHGLRVHLDGARFANALAATGATPAEMSWRAGVDVLVLGGTKNGLMGVEAVIFFDPARYWEGQLRRKRAGHLWSKERFLAAQMLAWLEDDLWLHLARHANTMGQALEAGLPKTLIYKRAANMLFLHLPRAAHARLQAAGAQYYLWPDLQEESETVSLRLVTSWDTQPEDVARFLAHL